MLEIPVDLAVVQHGLITTEQLRSAGFNRKQIHWTIERGTLVRLSARLLRVAGSPHTAPQRLLAAVLDAGPGSALSHTSALSWWGVPGFLLNELHVTHARDGVRRPAPLAHHVHDVVTLPDDHVISLEAVPVVTPARALFDVAGQRGIHPKRVERAVDNAWARRLVSGRSMHAMLEDLAQRGRPGVRLMRGILRDRGADYTPPSSGLEGRVAEILRRAGERPLRRQVDCGDEKRWIGRVDFADDQVPFVLEVQSERFHSSLLDQQSDRARLAGLNTAGFIVATVSEVDVWHSPSHVVETVRQGREQARRQINKQATDAA